MKKKTFKFYITLWIAKMASLALKVLRRNATYFPGKIALKLCPDFIGMIEKPKTIIGVTGTNGKTTGKHPFLISIPVALPAFMIMKITLHLISKKTICSLEVTKGNTVEK